MLRTFRCEVTLQRGRKSQIATQSKVLLRQYPCLSSSNRPLRAAGLQFLSGPRAQLLLHYVDGVSDRHEVVALHLVISTYDFPVQTSSFSYLIQYGTEIESCGYTANSPH